MAKLTLQEMLAKQKADKLAKENQVDNTPAVAEVPAVPATQELPAADESAPDAKPASSALAGKFGAFKVSPRPTTHAGNAGSPSGVAGGAKSGFSFGKKSAVHSDNESGGADGPATDAKRPDGPSGGLAALAATTESGIAPEIEAGTLSQYVGFTDEEPAQKPERDLPPETTEMERQFVGLLDSIYDVLHDPELVGSVLRNFMIELQQNPEYRKLVAPEDVRNLIIGARQSMGMAKVKKQEKKAKTTSRKSGMSKADQALKDLESLGIDFGAFGDD